MTTTSIRENLLHIQERIANAATRSGRRPEDITLIGVSKTHPAICIHEAYQAGVRHFGENRVQEWEVKRVGTNNLSATWHLIGHLQSNKAAKAAKLFHTVDSVDDFALAQKLDRARTEANSSGKLRVLLEVRVAKEETKSGVETAALPELAERVAALPHLDLAGLMCIPPFFGSVEAGRNLSRPGREPGAVSAVMAGLPTGSVSPADAVRPYFRRLRELCDELRAKLNLPLPVLSMGMSHDFEVAIEEGATEVRVGTALFGDREIK
ncbi:MAG TPA: YggS family pyridoxal phosphate-dependent enzyme [Candidatus Acidoferrum sp.]|nr:YggS family pyridoxal phosphate-dependent enzyme [Candidatus Acidoferrum sp.]